MTPELQSKISVWRSKLADGTLTPEELKEAVRSLREGRLHAASSSPAAKRTKAKATIKSADEMLQELNEIVQTDPRLKS